MRMRPWIAKILLVIIICAMITPAFLFKAHIENRVWPLGSHHVLVGFLVLAAGFWVAFTVVSVLALISLIMYLFDEATK